MGMMTYVKQKHFHDCGVACFAMLIDITYETAFHILFSSQPKKRKYYLTTKAIKTAAVVNGFIVEQDRLKRCKEWNDVPSNSLVKVWGEHIPKNYWHWVVYRKEKIYDPGRGVFKPDKYPLQLKSYLEVKKGPDTLEIKNV